MNSEYKLVKMNSSSIKDPIMIVKYASLGYFQYRYIKTLSRMDSGESLIKDHLDIKGNAVTLRSGSYLRVSIVDLKKKRKVTCLFLSDKSRLETTVGDLQDLCGFIYSSMTVDEVDCFVKFDAYTVLDD